MFIHRILCDQVNAHVLALYIPVVGRIRFTRVPVTHVAINSGVSIPAWGQFFDGAARSRTVHAEGATYYVLEPEDRSQYTISGPILEATGRRRRGPVLVFRRGVRSRLVVNMRTAVDDKRAVLVALSRYAITPSYRPRLIVRFSFYTEATDE